MKLPSLRTLFTLAAACIALAGYGYVSTLQRRIAATSAVAEQAQKDVAARDDIISQLLADKREKDNQRVKLEQVTGRVHATLSAYRVALKRLIDENEVVRAWAVEPLPADVARLHFTPALTGAADYFERMPAPDSLRAAGGKPHDER